MLRKIFGPTREAVTGEWRKLHNEELYDLYWSPNITKIKEDVMGRAYGMCRREEKCIQGCGGET